MGNRVADVNTVLRRNGLKERLTRGKGYYYFRDGDAPNWRSSSVLVYRADALTVDQWLDQYHDLSRDRG